MKKTCNGCRALEPSLSRYGYRCSLGYKMNTEKKGEYTKYAPAEECPKPKTISELINSQRSG